MYASMPDTNYNIFSYFFSMLQYGIKLIPHTESDFTLKS